MKTDTAPVRIVDRGGEEMIEVDEDRQSHDEPRPLPTILESQPRNEARNEEMESQVND